MSTAADPATKAPEPASASPLDAHAAPVADTKQRSGKATAALVLGILGTLAGFIIPAAGLILGILGIVFGRQAVNEVGQKSGRGLAQAGFVLGIIAVVVSIAIMIIRVVIITS